MSEKKLNVSVKSYFKAKKDGKIKGFATIAVAPGVALKVRVVQGANGIFAGLPSNKDSKGVFRDSVLLSEEMRAAVNQAAVDAHEAAQKA